MADETPITEADARAAIARAFGRDPRGELAPLDEALRAGSSDPRVRDLEEKLNREDISIDDLDAGIGKLAGRTGEPRKTVAEALEAEIKAAETATPWRDAASWAQREPLREAENRFAALVSTRRGQTIETARQYAEGVLREAWHRPGGFGTTHDRFVAAVRALEEGIDRLSNLSPIAPATAEESGKAPRMVQIVREGKPL